LWKNQQSDFNQGQEGSALQLSSFQMPLEQNVPLVIELWKCYTLVQASIISFSKLFFSSGIFVVAIYQGWRMWKKSFTFTHSPHVTSHVRTGERKRFRAHSLTLPYTYCPLFIFPVTVSSPFNPIFVTKSKNKFYICACSVFPKWPNSKKLILRKMRKIYTTIPERPNCIW